MSVSSSPRGEQPGRPGITWETELRTVEQVVEDDAPDPKPNRAARRRQGKPSVTGESYDRLWSEFGQERRRAELAEVAFAAEQDISRRLLGQRQEMAEERYAWQERGDRAESRAAEWELYARRFYLAWKSARRRAAVLSAELTRRAPLLGQSQAALVRVRLLHRSIDWHGMTICAECSGLDPAGDSTDGPPVSYEHCATITALNEPSDGAGADTARHCGGTLTHPGHQFMRLDVVFNCPGNTPKDPT